MMILMNMKSIIEMIILMNMKSIIEILVLIIIIVSMLLMFGRKLKKL